jgi:NtrC-family two-component system response regulator AlgB
MPKISSTAQTHMLRYSWPGNLRELRNAIERAVILAKADELSPDDMPGDMNGDHPNGDTELQPGAFISLERLEELHVRKVLERTATVTEAAHILGIDQATIYRKRKKMGLS